MGINLSQLGLPYSIWTLCCAALMPLLCAVAVFGCLHRSGTGRKLACYFIMMPLYVAFVVFAASDPASTVALFSPELSMYAAPAVGLLAALTFGILYLSLSSLICGAGVMKRGAATTNAVFTLICTGCAGFLTYRAGVAAHAKYITEYTGAATVSIREAVPELEGLNFLPGAILNSGVELAALAILLLYILVFFLCFTGNKKNEQILRDTLERRRRQTFRKSEKKNPRRKTKPTDDDALTRCCAYCEYGRILVSDSANVLCDRNGVVDAAHSCRRFLYDPLKRAPQRPSPELPGTPETEYPTVVDTARAEPETTAGEPHDKPSAGTPATETESGQQEE